MRILYVVPAIAQGGIEQMVCTWIIGMKKHGHKCEVLATTVDSHRESHLWSLNVPIHSVHLSSLKYFSAKKKIKYFLLKNHYDIIHGNVSYLNGVFAEVVNKEFPTIKFVSHAHLNSDRKCSSVISQIVNDASHVLMRKLIHKYSNLNLACSNNSGIYLFGDRNFTFFPNAIDTSKFKFSVTKREQLRKQYALDDNFVIMHAGRFSEVKNHTFLLDVFAAIYKIKSSAKLLLFGDGELQELITMKAAELGIESNVVCMGYRNDVNDFLNAADVFVLPSHLEGFPVALVEAQASGLRCVVSIASPQECDITGLITFLSLDDSIDVWRDSILPRNHTTQRESYHARLASSYFDIDKSTQYLQELYKNLLER